LIIISVSPTSFHSKDPLWEVTPITENVGSTNVELQLYKNITISELKKINI